MHYYFCTLLRFLVIALCVVIIAYHSLSVDVVLIQASVYKRFIYSWCAYFSKSVWKSFSCLVDLWIGFWIPCGTFNSTSSWGQRTILACTFHLIIIMMMIIMAEGRGRIRIIWLFKRKMSCLMQGDAFNQENLQEQLCSFVLFSPIVICVWTNNC